ncbi:hypothetical protein [Pseudomonas putida]
MYRATIERAELKELLKLTTDNSAIYAALTGADGVSEIGLPSGYSAQPDYRLIRVDHRLHKGSVDQFEIALVNDVEASLAFYATATLLSIPEVSSRKIAQHRVWRSGAIRHSSALLDISQAVLFGYILQRYDLLMAEDGVTGDGKFYWHRQVSRAVDLGFCVYVYDLATQALRPIPTQSALDDVQDQIWSGTASDSVQALISVNPLPRQ